jgi:phosphoglycerol transferase MdoB-like AlkP superfamily enzyme
LYIPIFAVIVVIMIELLARRSITGVFLWMIAHPEFFALNGVIASTIMAVAIAFSGRIIFGAAAGTILLILLGIINTVKLSILRAPFFAWDFLFARQLGSLGASVISRQMFVAFIILSAFLAGVFLYFLIKKFNLSTLRIRIFFLAVAVGFSGFFYRNETSVCNWLDIKNINWDQRENYARNGFLLAFSMNISPMLFSQPDEYDKDLVRRLIEHNDRLEDENGFDGQPVNLIFFMSESFSDLTDPLFESPDNPLENLKQLASQFPHFRLVSPTYAGNTSLVEFEALTGLSNAFLPSGAIPFEHYLRRQTPSLAWILKEHGYDTIAIHPFYDWFWNRNNVYPNLGFNEYLSISQFDETAKRGFYISDEALVDKIINVIDASDGPYFVHAVSMENHGPYIPGRFEQNEIPIGFSVSAGLRSELQSYLAGLRDADKQLARLLNYLKGRNEPVICLFFGDHQPSFGQALYNELGVMKEGIEMDYQLSVVPGLLWENRKGIIDEKDIPEQLSPAYLPAIILHQMRIPLPGHMFYLRHGLSYYPVVHRNFVVDPSGNLLDFNDLRTDPYIRGLEVLNFDVLFGSRFSCQL